MIRYRYKGAQLLFVGINPHQGSYDRGVPFSNNKMFWYLLAQAELLDELREKLKDDAYLRTVYRKWFNAARGLGFVNLIDRPTRDITLLLKEEELPGKARVKRIIAAQRPKVVCFIGKVAYEKFTGSRDFTFGWQTNIHTSRAFVMHFPLRGRADVRVRELRIVADAAGLS
jgi:double-stranded uracil-DNA glycosylase